MNRIHFIVGLLVASLLGPALATDVRAAPTNSYARRTSQAKKSTRRPRGLRIRARYRLERMRVKRSASRLKNRLAKSRFGRATKRGRRHLRRFSLATSARLTVAADWVERRLPGRLSTGFARLRLGNPLGMGSFATKLFKRDPKFMAGYGLWSYAFSNLQVPLLMSMGFGAGAAVALRFATGIPIDIGVIAWRMHAKRSDRSQTFGGTLRELGREYRDHVRSQQKRNRRVHRAISGRTSYLGHLADGLR